MTTWASHWRNQSVILVTIN